MSRFMSRERGDTLIEVTIALAILSAVLLSAYVVANRARLQGQAANERSYELAYAQRQAEALQSFRDTHTWAEFINGTGGNTPTSCNNAITKTYCGIRVRNCDPTAKLGCTFIPGNKCNAANPYPQNYHCFHMVAFDYGGGNVQWVPSHGPISILNYGGGGSSSTAIAERTPDSPAPPSYTFTIFYEIDGAGGLGNANGRNAGRIYLNLSNLDGLRQP